MDKPKQRDRGIAVDLDGFTLTVLDATTDATTLDEVLDDDCPICRLERARLRQAPSGASGGDGPQLQHAVTRFDEMSRAERRALRSIARSERKRRRH